MPPFALAGVSEVVLKWLMPNGQIGNNVLHVETPGVPTAADLGDVAGFFAVWWAGAGGAGDGLKSIMSTETRLSSIKVTDLSGPTGAQVEAAINEAGEVAEDPLPASTTLLVDWYSDVRGKSGRGHSALPAPNEGIADPDGNLVPLAITGIETDCQDLLDNLSGNSTPLTILSKTLMVFNEVTRFAVNPKFGIDRSRQGR